MKIENQVCNSNQAKYLNKLGVLQISYFVWHPSCPIPIHGQTWVTAHGKQYKRLPAYQDKASSSAFTVSELGVLLPEMYVSRFGATIWICYTDDSLLHDEKVYQ